MNISQLSEYAERNNVALKKQLREQANKLLTKLIHDMLDKADDILFDFSSNAKSDASQQTYLDAMSEIRLQRNSIERGFFSALNIAFDECDTNKTLNDSALASTLLAKADALELLDDDTVEENMAIRNMAEKLTRRFPREVFEVKSRMHAVYYDEDTETDEHPLSPFMIANAFGNTVKPLDIDSHVKLIIFKLFEKIVMGNMGYVYKEINAFLVEKNILPDLTYTYKSSPSNHQVHEPQFDNGGSSWGPPGTNNLLPTNFGLHGFTPMPTQANGVISTLNAMQHYICDQGYPEDIKPSEIGISIIQGIQQMGFPSVLNKQSLDEKIINTVSNIFDFILGDSAIPQQIKNILSRLQVPYLKVALIDETFLLNKDHSARNILNDMAKASIGWSETSSRSDLLKTIESTVEAILNGYEQDNQIFYNLHKEFTLYWKNEQDTNRSYEERIWKTTEGKERVQHAKKRVDAWIHMWCSHESTRSQIATFLKHLWKNTMLYCMHKYGEDSREWRYYVKIINALIWSTTPGKNSDDIKQLINITPLLIRGLNRGMLAVGTHPNTISNIFREISKCHLEIIESGLSNSAQDGTAEKTNDLQTKKIQDSYSKDPEMAAKTIKTLYRPTAETELDKPDLEVDAILELLVEEVVVEACEPEEQTENNQIEDDYFKRAQALEYGDWVQFEIGGESVFAKLAWKSAVTTNHLFVGRDGTRVTEKPLAEIAELLRVGTALCIDQAPVVERALHAVSDSIDENEVDTLTS